MAMNRKHPEACKMFRFCGHEIRVIERVTYAADGTESYMYEPRMTYRAYMGRKFDRVLVVGAQTTREYGRYMASSSEAVDPAMIFDDPDVAQYAAVVAVWRWIQDGKGTRGHVTQ